MKKPILFLVVALALSGAAFTALEQWPIGNEPQLEALEGVPDRGAYLARMAGCIACHTNVAGDGKPLAGGLALKTDFGTFYSPNLTTHKEQGIGAWSIDDFARAVRQGVSPEGTPYYPAFPYPFYAKLSDQDIADLWSAFQTVPPVAEPSIPQDLGFPFNIRASLKIWRGLFLDSTGFKPAEGKSEMWQRGQYIVEGPAHCAACHTPRNILGARQAELKLRGADKLPDGGKSPAITSQALKKRGWDKDSLAYALRTGLTPDGDVFGGSMGEVVRDGTSFLSQQDREAIATFLLDLDE
ncbi:c-type cytochrome [Cohaesibacter sp. CAU 1516]|uniref:c-type cytochrome n=1 Tax=Cohaesibacter sp. CAU 1516 TaxID=2576038 RepID=UPI0010FD6BB0|nr:cytochrome c [Cohaesibacter sp. CAU 1516]TLP41910.1 c-type cytochrome [Cohaesibacter sp. CAU 1516]